MIEIFTDGACSGNPGPGGWAALLRYRGHEKEISGAEILTTNNRMEMRAVIEALKTLKKPGQVHLTTDSQYVKNGVELWMKGWKAKGWPERIKNKDLWLDIDRLTHLHHVQFHWVRGHNGHADNERVDALARQAIDTLRQSTQKADRLKNPL